MFNIHVLMYWDIETNEFKKNIQNLQLPLLEVSRSSEQVRVLKFRLETTRV